MNRQMTENTRNNKMTLVLGGTGKTGRRVAERLTARGVPTRIGSRSGQPLGESIDGPGRPRGQPDQGAALAV